MKKLLAVLLSVDKTLSEHPDLKLLLEADELFNIIFKITYYDDLEHAVCNADLSKDLIAGKPHRPIEHSKLVAKI